MWFGFGWWLYAWEEVARCWLFESRVIGFVFGVGEAGDKEEVRMILGVAV